MDRSTSAKLAKRATAILFDALEKDFDLKDVRQGRVVYDPTGGNCTITFEFIKEGGLNTYEREWQANARLYGMDPDWLGHSFRQGDGVYTIIGLKASQRKYPVIATNSKNGKNYKFDAETIRLRMGNK